MTREMIGFRGGRPAHAQSGRGTSATNTNDKTYGKAIIAPDSMGQAMAAFGAVARGLAEFYKSLVDGGVPEEYARDLTEEFAEPIKLSIYKGAGLKVPGQE